MNTRHTDAIFDSVRAHEFHPIRDGFTYDRDLDTHGVADLDDRDGIVRVTAIRDLVRAGPDAVPDMLAALEDADSHVRSVAATALGILGAREAVPALTRILAEDPDEVVRSHAAIALGEIAEVEAPAALRRATEEDASKDVRHQAKVAAYAIENERRRTPELLDAWKQLDLEAFNSVQVGRTAPDFTLADTDGNEWTLSEHLGDGPVVLIWIFADWCPVCHHEFHDLIEHRERWEEAGITVATLQAHDIFRSRVMTGQEMQPEYWFNMKSTYEDYMKGRWWSHLSDRAAAVGGRYGIRPMAFTVHAEWINRPAAVVIDREGIVRFSYIGTFWGDRPSIPELLEIVTEERYGYENPRRLRRDGS